MFILNTDKAVLKPHVIFFYVETRIGIGGGRFTLGKHKKKKKH